MKVLLTGAFGNIGMSTIEELLKQGHQVVCFDLKTKANQRAAQVFKNRLQIRWGDIRNRNELKDAVIDQEAVIHLAAIIPPQADLRPQLAEEVNIGGTRNLLNVLKAQTDPPRLIYASSIAVYGHTQDQEPPRTINDPIDPFEPYAKHKAQCEQLIRASKLTWAILRLSAVPMLNQPLARATVRLMFEAGPHNRIEFVHSRDVGLALANAVSSPLIWGKTLLIGGGPNCQMYLGDYIGRSLEALGVGRLPDEAFSNTAFHTDWVDTIESERLLHYQHHTYDDYLREMVANFGFKRYLLHLLRPLVRRWMLAQSPYFKEG